MSWHKIWLVLRREYLFNFRRPSFLFTAFGVPALSLGGMFFIFQFTADRETNLDNYQRVGYIDRGRDRDRAGDRSRRGLLRLYSRSRVPT